jgi:hypothetical protein
MFLRLLPILIVEADKMDNEVRPFLPAEPSQSISFDEEVPEDEGMTVLVATTFGVQLDLGLGKSAQGQLRVELTLGLLLDPGNTPELFQVELAGQPNALLVHSNYNYSRV